MKRCPQCNRVETDEALKFCRVDGATLVDESSAPGDEAGTAQLVSSGHSGEVHTSILPHTTGADINRATAPTTVLPQTAPSTTSELRKQGSRKTPVIVGSLIGLAIIAALIISGYLYFSRPSSAAIQSIAVLPFENRSGTSDTDYLSDGLADSLIYRLSQLPNLKVSPTSSVMRYKGKETDVAAIAKALQVDAVMSGRLMQRGDDLSISVQLIDARSNKLIWAEQYERKMSDLLATQREIATTITQKLELKLSGNDAKGITKRYTDSNEAYQLYMKGRYSFAKRTREDTLRAIDYFQQAIKLDPKFALAYARLSETYGSMPAYPYLSPKEAMPQAQVAAQQALQADPTLAEAHTFLAYSLVIDWNWTEAERSFKRAIELDPNNATAHFRYGQMYLSSVGRIEEALAEMKRGLDQEPKSDPASQFALEDAGVAYAKAGQRDKAEEMISRYREIAKTQYVASNRIAVIYAALVDRDKAFEELRKSFEVRDWELFRLNAERLWDPLREDARFKEMVKRLNLPE